jgi:hypothetical protein
MGRESSPLPIPIHYGGGFDTLRERFENLNLEPQRHEGHKVKVKITRLPLDAFRLFLVSFVTLW